MRRIEVNGCKIDILPVIKGLVSEGEKVSTAIKELSPDVVGVTVSKEELEGLRNKENYEKYEMSFFEEVFKAHLDEFGEVALPSPCFVKALDDCTEMNIPIIPMDMNEDLFSDTYCVNVNGLDLVREWRLESKIHKVRFNYNSPEEFVLIWDKKVNGYGGFKKLGLARRKHVVDRARSLMNNYKNILIIIDIELFDYLVEEIK